MDVREGNFNEKILFSQGERLIRLCSNCWKLKLPIPDAGASNKLIFNGERAIDLFTTGLNNLKKSNKKKTGKIRQFARCFIDLFIPIIIKFSY